MAQSERLRRGIEVMGRVYGKNVTVTSQQCELPFWKLLLEDLFCDVWGRKAMSIRDRRLILIGAIAAIADVSLIEIQLNAALDNGELEIDQLREIPLILQHYIGVPRTVPVMHLVERLVEERGGGQG